MERIEHLRVECAREFFDLWQVLGNDIRELLREVTVELWDFSDAWAGIVKAITRNIVNFDLGAKPGLLIYPTQHERAMTSLEMLTHADLLGCTLRQSISRIV